MNRGKGRGRERNAAAAACALFAAGCAAEGVRGDLDVLPGAVDLGTGPAGGVATASLSLRNQGEGYLWIDDLLVDEDSEGALTLSLPGWHPPLLLGPGEQASLDLVVAWPEEGEVDGRMRVVASAPLTWTGGGLPPALAEGEEGEGQGRVEQVVTVRGEVR